MRSIGSPERILGPLAASGLEAGWLTLLYLLIEGLWADALTPLPGAAFASVALLGLGFGRWGPRLGGPRYQVTVAALAVTLAVVGLLIPFGSRVSNGVGDPLAVIGAHPAGVLLGVAFLRGIAHTPPGADERIAEAALGPGLVAIATAWLLLAASGLTRQPATAAPAFVATVTYVAAGLLSLGLARLVSVRRQGVAGADRRMWVVLVVGVVCASAALAIPLGVLAGLPLGAATRALADPFWALLSAALWVLLLPAALLVAVLFAALDFVHGLVGYVPRLRPPPVVPTWTPPWTQSSASVGVDPSVLVLLVPIVLVALFLALVRLLGRPPVASLDPDVVEIHEPERPAAHLHLPRIRSWRRRRRPDPTSASEAYEVSLELISGQPDWARRPSETPREHARRVGSIEVLAPIRRLAADYALAEFGHRTLSRAEHVRAIGRWRELSRNVERDRGTRSPEAGHRPRRSDPSQTDR